MRYYASQHGHLRLVTEERFRKDCAMFTLICAVGLVVSSQLKLSTVLSGIRAQEASSDGKRSA